MTEIKLELKNSTIFKRIVIALFLSCDYNPKNNNITLVARFLFTILIVLNTMQVSRAQNSVEINQWVTDPLEERAPLLFIDFWATWCTPCHHVQPHVQQLADASKGTIDFMQMADQPSHTIEKFLIKNGYHHANAVDFERHSHEKYDVTSLPFAVILDSDLKVIWSGHPSDMSINGIKDLSRRYQDKKVNSSKIEIVGDEQSMSDSEIEYVNVSMDGINFAYGEAISDQPYILETQNWLTIQGDLRFIFSQVFKVPDFNIQIDNNTESKFWNLRLPSSNPNEALISFIDQQGVQLSKNWKQKTCFLVQGADSSLWWSNEMYDYGAGNYIATDYSLEIDNVDFDEFCQIMSTVLETDFVNQMDSTANGLHDWSVYIYDDKTMLKQLQEDYGFTIVKENRLVETYALKSKL